MHGHHRAGVYHRALHEFLLGAARVRVDQRQHAEVRRAQAERLQRRGELAARSAGRSTTAGSRARWPEARVEIVPAHCVTI